VNEHALGVLEFSRALDLVAGFAGTSVGAARVRERRPVSDMPSLEREHARVAAMRALVGGDQGWAVEPIPDLGEALPRLRVGGTVWTAAELRAGALLLRSSRRTRDALVDDRRPAVATAVLAELSSRLVAARHVEDAVDRALDDDGNVRDDASPVLRRVRRELRGAEGDLVRLLERLMSRLESHHQVADMSVTVRNGRYVIPVRREGRAGIGGIVHDTSASGATVFVEPPAAIEAGNRIRELEAEEMREIDRILRELTELLRPLHDGLLDAFDALGVLDSLYARARYGLAFRCSPAELVPARSGFALVDARHPLLAAQRADVVPFSLAMFAEERTLLVSGPNTGGKTVLLKAVGLVSALAQAGIPAPVGPESRIAVFDDLFADVGDEQSIQASLSTFSAHLRNLAEILDRATADSLVLVDELGSGTDPMEGAALGGAILEALTTRGTTTVATTHLGALKELATEVSGVVNASLQFDAVALAPTYRLLKGVPGQSYGLSIARRLHFPDDVLQRAQERVPTGERDVAALLAELERREALFAELERETSAHAEELSSRAQLLAEREQSVTKRERDAERAGRKDARQYLLQARDEIERTIQELRAVEVAGLDDAARVARRRAEQLAGSQADRLRALDDSPGIARASARPGATSAAEAALAPGAWVEVASLGGRTGQVVELRDGDAVVALGGVKLTLPASGLRRAARQSAAEVPVRIYGDVPDPVAPTEIDVRGLRVDEMEERVLYAVDSAVRADLKAMRLIHGKGTGALRERVAELLRKDTRVKTFRLGLWNEGGTGVTIAEFS